MAWKLAGTATGTNTVNMPTEYNEILLAAKRNTTYFYVTVPKAEVVGEIYPRFAFYYRADIADAGYFTVNSSTAKLGQWVVNGGTSVVNEATFKLYYR